MPRDRVAAECRRLQETAEVWTIEPGPLRDRILAQATIPRLPKTWLVESALSSAGGSPSATSARHRTRR